MAGASPSEAQHLSASERARLLARPAIDRGVVDRIDEAGTADVLIHLGDAWDTGRIDELLRDLPDAQLRSRRRYRRVPMLSARVAPDGLARLLERAPALRVSLDVPVEIQLAQAIPLVGIDLVHAVGDTGVGVQIAFIDTGIDTDHPDLAPALLEERCFCDDAPGMGGCCHNGFDTDSGPGAAEDDHGHGTRVAGVLASQGGIAPVGGAPGAGLIAIKAVTASGGGSGSDLIAALDWIVSDRPQVGVVNMSLGGGQYAGDCDAADAFTLGLADAIDALRARGTVVIAGAGNSGWGGQMIAPACVANAISVGAVWDSAFGPRTEFGCTDETAADLVTCWSNASSTTDVFAPGGLMGSTQIGGSVAHYAGTSYATPVVAACAALLQADFPSASADEIADALRTSPVWVVDDTSGLSFPRLQCSAAYASLAPSLPTTPDGAGWLVLGACLTLAGAIALHREGRSRAA